MPELAEWNDFYVIVGTAAGALIGLQFVMMTLIAQRPSPRAAEASPVFSTPTIVHFAAALFLAAVLRAPWHGRWSIAVVCGLVGLAGAGYLTRVTRRMRRQHAYQLVLEDVLFHVVAPGTGYVLLIAGAVTVRAHPREALFGIGAAALLLLFASIHNAWDAVVYYVFEIMGAGREE